jgi:hypothetical protein
MESQIMSIITVTYNNSVKNNKVTINNSQGQSVTSDQPKALLDLLGKNYTDALNRKMFWDIDQFLAPVCKVLGNEICQELVKQPNCEARFRFNGEVPEIIPFTDIKEPLPADAYSLFYRKESQAGLKIPTEAHKSYFYSVVNHNESVEDVTDLQTIADEAKKVVDAYFSMNLNPMKMSSPISIYESNVLEHLPELPTIADIPMSSEDTDEYVQWCEECKDREFTTNFAIGRWKANENWSYDIQSAFGYYFSELYNFKYTTMVKSSTPIKSATDGLLKGTVTIYPDVKVSPICFRKKINGQQIYPTGCSWEDKLTLAEVRWLYKYKIGEFKLDYGYFQTQDAPQQPFKVTMQRIFNQREQGGLVKNLAKRIGASAWSKCIQRANSQDGNKYYAPNFALTVKTNCRLRVASFIYDNGLQNNVLSIATDGVRTSKPALNTTFTYGLGQWRQEPQEDCIIISPSQIVTAQKKPRSLYYKDIVELINKQPEETYYETTKLRRLTLAEAVDKGELDKVGDMVNMAARLDLTMARTEQDYQFSDYPNCGEDLLECKYYGQPITDIKGL